MSIGRIRKFSTCLAQAIERIKAEAEINDLGELDVTELLNTYGDLVYAEITKLFNFVFEYRNDEYEPATQEWVEEEVTIRELKEIVLKVAEANGLGWLLPFFKSNAMEMIRSTASKMAKKAENPTSLPNGKSTAS